jgi:hypothetical protein
MIAAAPTAEPVDQYVEASRHGDEKVEHCSASPAIVPAYFLTEAGSSSSLSRGTRSRIVPT